MWIFRPFSLKAAAATAVVAAATLAFAGEPDVPAPRTLPAELGPLGAGVPVLPITPIDLAAALRMAGVENPQILIARQRIALAVAERQYAAAQILPSLNVGLNYDDHTGALQQSTGNILSVNRSAMYVGAGANAVGSGTVNIPGVVYNLNVSQAIFNALIAKQGVERTRFASLAVKNETFRRVAIAYSQLLRAEGRRSVALQTRNEAAEVARVTAAFAKTGQGTLADADRGASELERRNTDLIEAENEVLLASARLAELLAMDQNVRLHPVEDKLVPMPVVPDPIPLKELLAIAALQRPELAERQAAVRQAMLALSGSKLLPFSPTLIVGFSSGTFGGGSGLVASTGGSGAPGGQSGFGNFGQRNDTDAVAYWTLQNCGVGNVAMIRAAAANLSINDLQKLEVFNRVAREVADAYVRTHVRFAQIPPTEEAVVAGQKAFKEDFQRITGGVGLPIALLQSLRLLGQARYQYLDAIVQYNEAQIDLFVALGQPPADTLARPIPTDFVQPVEVPLNAPRKSP